ncbi:MAG: hypothetical protein JNJ57_03840 [Saprospiraceae bacterium]|nr:hypothetical protein [Saprospiraceae bacterium]
MESNRQTSVSTPEGHFSLEEIQAFQGFENLRLVAAAYYLWTDVSPETNSTPWLWALELQFEGDQQLLISPDEAVDSLRILPLESLLKTAEQMHQLHGAPVVQRLSCHARAPWNQCIGNVLQAIRLSRGEEGFYLNDALLLDFGANAILVALHPDAEGMIIQER